MRFPRQKREEVNVNLTPLIDVVFLLLIFFMVSTTFTKETHLEVDLPQASGDKSVVEEQILEILITDEGNYSVNGKPLVNTQAATLRRALKELSGEKRDMPLVITADAKTPHQSVVTAMDVSGQLGFSKLSITTRDPDSE
ncbi:MULTISPECIES: biopolymer transporter ExbD [unclassified Neptuniibacter]|uniref:ExbD/TolR family protein n=1 Tax=unclassified Neptuniibacter TaxID=2630693 RepID=UPI0026E1ACAA|nr:MULTISPECIES: biopolymer transporter ExbD [unclassified Neptuniibacter]MDO6513270.1 biopolymer transporter ExbD [Neptuniibacter sp. 2_MG-2023]MDO6595067.1 biopolymer transporter ExbD [Neptuniibacter sp. 1_MG-2023]